MDDPYAKTKYKKNFVTEVIARVDFVTPLLGVGETLPPELSKLALGPFPIAEPHDGVRHKVKIDSTGFEEHREPFKEWRFHGKERTKTLTIGQQVVLVQHEEYQTYDLVRDEFCRIIRGVAQLSPLVQTSRVGLRYVNIIKLPTGKPTDWSSYLNPNLLSLFEFPPEGDQPALSRVFHSIDLALDGFNLRYRLGMNNPDYPARIRQRVFVLDYDAYTDSAGELGNVCSLLDRFHAKIQEYFETSVRDPLREMLDAN